MALLALSGLTKRFGQVRAVEDFSLEIRSGELLALLGPSGCGKTTVLRLIAGFETPDAGEIHLNGRSVLQEPPERRGVGVVFQHYALFPHLDVAGNVAYGLRFLKGREDRRARVAELLELVGLVGLERRRPEALSAGQRQRVALARALAPRPRVLLLDEPLSALDVQLRERLRGEIRRILRAAGTTALYITHDQEEALAIADRVAVMRAGRLEQVDTPQELYRRPRTPFVAEFVGRGNLLPVRVLGSEAQGLRLRLAEEAECVVPAPPPAGEKAWLLVRPEQLKLEPAGGLLQAVVQACEYLGDRYRFRLRWAGGTLWVQRDGHAPGPHPASGDRVGLSFDPRQAWVLPEGEAR